jgi:hypothetical protein
MFAESMSELDQDTLQFTDGIFAQALIHFSATSQSISIDEMVNIALGITPPPKAAPTQKH